MWPGTTPSGAATSVRRGALFLVVCLLAAAPASAQMYKWVDKDGKVHYSDKPPPGTKAQVIAPAPAKPAPVPVQANEKSRTPAGFSPEEREALHVLCGIRSLQTRECPIFVKRICTFDELVAGVPGRPAAALVRDP